MSTVAMMVFLPALVFAKIVSNIDNSDIKEIGTIALEAVFVIIIQGLLTFLFGVLAGCPKNWYGGLLSCGMFANISDIPIAYLQSMESSNMIPNVDKGVSYICIYLCMQIIAQFNLGGFKLIELDFRNEIKKRNGDTEASQSIKSNENVASHSSDATQTEKANGGSGSDSQDHDPNNFKVEDNSDLGSESPMSLLSLNTEESHSIAEPASLNYTTSARQRKDTQLSRHPSIAASLFDNNLQSAPAENMKDVVRTYSKYNQLVEDEMAKAQESESFKAKPKINMTRIISGIKGHGKAMISLIITSTLKPMSISLIFSITVSMIPWVKALFVTTHQAHLSSAPDGMPPLSFIMDFASYVGNAQVPLGLILLGGTIGRLQVNNMNAKIWKVPILVTIFKLCIFPVIGCAVNSKFSKDGLFYNDDVLYFVSNINYCLPPATALLYLTAIYIPPDQDDAFQMDMLALVYIAHYMLLVVCLPFVTSYTVKVSLGY
ncbi:unnamed protein product [Ambrosiozyma monospora]|uniref:Unnamed protein product n=2 Tax=Ambrosiozyma monospora TaxID=43982 RepID=A0ACB5U0F0_AMBMO|nr:unnamed protein product [Ambrosiozyma monospora]